MGAARRVPSQWGMRTLSLLVVPAIGALALAACDPAPPSIDPLPPLEWNAEPRVALDEPPVDAGPPPPDFALEPDEAELAVEPEPVPDPVNRSIGAPTPAEVVEAAPMTDDAASDADPVPGETTVWTDDPAELAAADPAQVDDLIALQEQMVALQDELAALRAQHDVDKRQAEVDALLTSILAAETAAFVYAVASQNLVPAQLAPSRTTPSRSAPAMSQSRKSAR